jgi:hypothetical protein
MIIDTISIVRRFRNGLGPLPWRYFLLACGSVFFAGAAFLPPWPHAETAWMLTRFGLFSLAFAALLPALLILRADRFSLPRRVSFAQRPLLWCAEALIILIFLSSGATRWSSATVISNWADVTSYFAQARIFAAGHLAVPSAEPREFFDAPYMFNQGRVFSKYPPGWPALLALGMRAHIPWIVNPLLTLLTLAALYRLGRLLYDEEIAAMATGLMAVSMHVVYHATTYFSEPASMLFATLGVLTALKAIRSSSPRAWFLAGCCWGMLFLIRPYTAAALGVPMAIRTVWSWRRRPDVLPVVAAVIPFASLVALHLLYNRLSVGSCFSFPFSLYNPHDRLGFGLRSLDVGFPLARYGISTAVGKLIRVAVMANVVFIPIGFVFMAIALAGRRHKEDWFLFLCFVANALCYFFYFAQQERYWMPVFFTFALLAAKGIRRTGSMIESRFRGYPAWKTTLSLFSLVVAASLTLTTDKLCREEFPLRRRMADPIDRVAETGLRHAVVFLASSPIPNVGHYIQPTLNGDVPVLFARDLGERNIELMRCHPDRDAYRYTYDNALRKGSLQRIDGN